MSLLTYYYCLDGKDCSMEVTCDWMEKEVGGKGYVVNIVTLYDENGEEVDIMDDHTYTLLVEDAEELISDEKRL